jgi:hypothetical protein
MYSVDRVLSGKKATLLIGFAIAASACSSSSTPAADELTSEEGQYWLVVASFDGAEPADVDLNPCYKVSGVVQATQTDDDPPSNINVLVSTRDVADRVSACLAEHGVTEVRAEVTDLRTLVE